MFFISRQKKIESAIHLYCEKVALCLDRAVDAVGTWFGSNDRRELHQRMNKVHQAESQADNIRRDIEVMLYSKSIFPESRGDILGLLEALDKVPNQTETVVRMLYIQHIHIPEAYRPGIIELLEVARRCTTALIDATGKLFSNFPAVGAAVGKVDQLESDADVLENTLIESVFASEMDGFDKIMLRDVIHRLAHICDRAETAADRISIIIAKRKI
ncbi:MAG: DUF47 domain-containing protein [Sedimentisphaerales bacterium]|nr:DUF47 domain-containing protein [Sedimentisphaerales bacterium]